MKCVDACSLAYASGVVAVLAIGEGGTELAVVVVVKQRDLGEPLHATVGALVGGSVGVEGAAAGETVSFEHVTVVTACARPVAVGGVEGERATGRLAHCVRGNGLNSRK